MKDHLVPTASPSPRSRSRRRVAAEPQKERLGRGEVGPTLEALLNLQRRHSDHSLGRHGLDRVDPVGGAFQTREQQQRYYGQRGPAVTVRRVAHLADDLGDEVGDAVHEWCGHQYAGGALVQEGGGDQQPEGDHPEGQPVQALRRWSQRDDHRQQQRYADEEGGGVDPVGADQQSRRHHGGHRHDPEGDRTSDAPAAGVGSRGWIGLVLRVGRVAVEGVGSFGRLGHEASIDPVLSDRSKPPFQA